MMYQDAANGLILPHSLNEHAISEREYAATVALLETRLAQLELQLDEQGWIRLADQGSSEFSREGLGRITDLARVNYLKNPLIRRAVEIGALYVWGQDLSVNADDEQIQAVIDRFWRDNRRTLTGQQASRLTEVELQVTGNLFLALFPDKLTGQVRVRTVPMEEIREIITNPEDRYEPWYYKRTWTAKALDGTTEQRTRYYPDWQYQPSGTRPDRIGDHGIVWETPLLHIKVGAFPHWRWGVSEVYAALDWAKAYKELLEDDATRSRALSRFAWQLTTAGGKAGVTAAKTKLGTTLGAGGNGETNPPPVAGSTFIAGQGVGLNPVNISSATLNPDHSRPARLMASAGLGISDHFFDADVGNHATASTLDRPTELRYAERRQLWRDVLTDLLQWVIDRDVEATRGILRSQPTEEQRKIDLAWPDLLERDITERVGAIVSAATLGGSQAAGTLPSETVSRLLLVALGVDDVDSELANLDDDEGEAAPREAFVAALRDVREALRVGAR